VSKIILAGRFFFDCSQSGDGLVCCRASHVREGEAAQNALALKPGVKPGYHGLSSQVPSPKLSALRATASLLKRSS
jgi:hypothetical protein